MRFSKWYGLVVVGIVVLLFVGQAPGAPSYQDGMAIGISDANRNGYVMAIVAVQGGKIASVNLSEITQYGVEKDAGYPWEEWKVAMETLPKAFVDANSSKVDHISKATHTSDKAMQAVERALVKLSDAKAAGKYFDGVFLGRSADNPRGYAVAWVTIENDKIVNVETAEVIDTNTFKDWETYAYRLAFEGKQVMEQRFVDANGTDVDLFTGATSSAQKYIEAVDNALKLAER